MSKYAGYRRQGLSATATPGPAHLELIANSFGKMPPAGPFQRAPGIRVSFQWPGSAVMPWRFAHITSPTPSGAGRLANSSRPAVVGRPMRPETRNQAYRSAGLLSPKHSRFEPRAGGFLAGAARYAGLPTLTPPAIRLRIIKNLTLASSRHGEAGRNFRVRHLQWSRLTFGMKYPRRKFQDGKRRRRSSR